MSGRLPNMKYIAIVAVAGLSLILAIPLSRPVKQPIDLSFKPIAHKVAVTAVPKPTVTHTAKVLSSAQPAPVITPAPVAVAQPTYTPASHEDLMAQAGIAPSDFAAVDYIVSRESGWNADATEPTSGAHGLPQALPYSKTGCGWEDAVCQLQWANTYAVTRYGGWWAAQAYWALHRNW